MVVENLDRWGVDEIFIQVIDRSTSNLGPDLDLINEISESGILTPIVYAGGIQNSKQAAEVVPVLRGFVLICYFTIIQMK